MGLVLKGFKIIEGNDGMFIGFPSQKDAEGNYFDTIHASKEIKAKVHQLALDAYGGKKTNEELVGSSSNDEEVPF